MTFTKILLLTFINVGLGVVMKVYIFKNFYTGTSAVSLVCYWLLTAVLAAACVRRFGVMNFFEVCFIGVIWIVVTLLADLLITAVYTGNRLFALWPYWVGFVVTAGTMLVSHKMRHVHIRHELHAAKHAKEHGHGAGHSH